MSRKKVLIVFPTMWDARQLHGCRADWEDAYEIQFEAPTAEDCPYDLDIGRYIDRIIDTWKGRIDGVFSSSDYPGATIAGAVATELGLPGCRPDILIRASHKYYSRLIQRDAVPEATPEFFLVDPRDPRPDPAMQFPVFIKPVKGAFSVHSRKINSRDELESFLMRPVITEFTDEYLAVFNQLVRDRTSLEKDGRYFLAESFIHGTQVTVEGCVSAGEVRIYGIVDSVMHLGLGSFARFDYPSALRPEIQEDMKDIALRAVTALQLDNCHFNIEMIYEASDDAIRIIEVNPRLCGQFGDLFQKVDGCSSYVMALDVATGRTPRAAGGKGRYAAATSFPLRLFDPVRIDAAPDAERIGQVEATWPGTLVWVECESGQVLDDFHTWEDGNSCRYAIVNIGADSRRELRARLAAVREALGFRMSPAARQDTVGS